MSFGRASIPDLAIAVRRLEQPAALELVARLLDGGDPPRSFCELVERIPDMSGRMTIAIFDLIADAYSAVRAEREIRALPQQPAA